MCLGSCCPRDLKDPHVAERSQVVGVTLLEGHSHDLLHGLVVLGAHLRIRPDFGGQSGV